MTEELYLLIHLRLLETRPQEEPQTVTILLPQLPED